MLFPPDADGYEKVIKEQQATELISFVFEAKLNRETLEAARRYR